MASTNIVHARLDPAELKILERLRRRTGLRDSELIRRALRALDEGASPPKRLKVVGVGKFRSGITDLGSNPDHLRGFGR